MSRGAVFDTLEQGSSAAMNGHGVAIADLLLSLDALNSGLLALPFKEAIATGDGYYIVWPKNSLRKRVLNVCWTGNLHAPVIPSLDIICLEYDEHRL